MHMRDFHQQRRSTAASVACAPAAVFNARCKACWLTLGIVLLVLASFATLDLRLAQWASWDAWLRMGRFVGELLHRLPRQRSLARVEPGHRWNAGHVGLGTLIAAVLGLLLALPGARNSTHKTRKPARAPWRLLFNALRSVPELVWAALLFIAGPGAVCGRWRWAYTAAYWADCLPKAWKTPRLNPPRPLRLRGVDGARMFLVRRLAAGAAAADQLHPVPLGKQHRAATVLGVVGGGGLGQMLAFHMGLFQMGETSTVLLAMRWRWWRWWMALVTRYARSFHSASARNPQTHSCCAEASRAATPLAALAPGRSPDRPGARYPRSGGSGPRSRRCGRVPRH